MHMVSLQAKYSLINGKSVMVWAGRYSFPHQNRFRFTVWFLQTNRQLQLVDEDVLFNTRRLFLHRSTPAYQSVSRWLWDRLEGETNDKQTYNINSHRSVSWYIINKSNQGNQFAWSITSKLSCRKTSSAHPSDTPTVMTPREHGADEARFQRLVAAWNT